MIGSAMADAHRVRIVVAPNAGLLTLDGSRTYVVGGDPCVVIDPGPALADHLDAVEIAVGSAEVVAIALTHGHPDHAAGAPELALRLGAPVAASRASAELADIELPAVELTPGRELAFEGGSLTAIRAPGHSPDHVCFHWPEADALFTGDVILGEGTSMIAPPEGDLAAYLETLRRLRDLAAGVIYPGHGPPVADAAAKIEEYLTHRLEREAQVLEALATGSGTPAEIRAQVYPDLDPRLNRAAEGSVRAHLAKLEGEGRVEARGDRYRLLT